MSAESISYAANLMQIVAGIPLILGGLIVTVRFVRRIRISIAPASDQIIK